MTKMSDWALALIMIKTLFLCAISALLLLSEQYVAAGVLALVATIMHSSTALSFRFGKLTTFVTHKVVLDSSEPPGSKADK